MIRLRLLQAAVAIAFFGVLLASSRPAKLRDALGEIDVPLAAAAAALNLPVLVLAPLRSHLVMRRLGYGVAPRVLVPATVLGFVAGGLTPAAAGELLRAEALRSRAGLPFASGIALVLFERLLSAYVLALSSAAVFALTRLRAELAAAVLVLALLAVAAPWLLGHAPWPLTPSADERGGWRTAVRRVAGLAAELRRLARDPLLLVSWSALTLAVFGVIALQYWLLGRAVAGGVGFGEAWLALGVSTLAGIASLIPFGLGALDGSLAAMLDRLGMTLEQGGAVAVLVRGCVTLPLALCAVVAFFYLRRLREERGPRGVADGPER